MDGKNAVSMRVFQLPGHQCARDGQAVYEAMARHESAVPRGAGLPDRLRSDQRFVRQSFESVLTTLLEAIAAGGAGGHPVPAELARLDHSADRGAGVADRHVRGDAALGSSLNNLSLFGLVLAIGIVVDDAIVVVENVERNIAAGPLARDATLKAMSEVSGR
jgi:multidrug efflux pump subunit AcrB